jgi:hypothetical protein
VGRSEDCFGFGNLQPTSARGVNASLIWDGSLYLNVTQVLFGTSTVLMFAGLCCWMGKPVPFIVWFNKQRDAERNRQRR